MDYTKKPFYLSPDDLAWVEATFAAMTQEEKLNQVFVDMLWNESPKAVEAQQTAYQLGGYRYNNSTPENLWEQNTAIQRASKIPALIAANVEAGGNGADSGGTKLGEGIACGATDDPMSAYYMGKYGCREAAAIGCSWTFAPIVDIDLNWRNCVIAHRAFGNDPDKVLAMGLAYMKGAHEEGVACCMKHFPGDGCDERDQHLVTTVNDLSCEEWDATFGKVYRGMIDGGVPSVMIGHIMQPAWSRALRPGIKDEEILPATVAPELLQGLLRGKLGFNGLIVTDATHMVGLTGKVQREVSIPAMLMAGCDMILYYRDHDEDIGFLKAALADGRLTQERLDEAVRTVLAFKAHRKLHEKQRAGTLMPPREGLSVIGCKEHKAKAAQIIDRSITLVKDTKRQLPLTPERHRRIIIYTVESGGILTKVKDMIFGNKNRRPTDVLAEELKKNGFEPTVFKLNYLKYLTPKGVNGKKAIAEYSTKEFAAMYDAAIVLCNVSSFSSTNERSLHWSIPMGPEIPWYATEIPTVAISVAHPFHLIDLAMVPTYINTYNANEETIRQTVEKLMGKSAFKGISPVDAFCGRWDTRL
ncbi:MAG: glycosyl hydrolase family 3 [Oscillospiraceae bacterium]|nr:glycosyl hydrolase family 3 [Oscillospiraceae bacterium]